MHVQTISVPDSIHSDISTHFGTPVCQFHPYVYENNHTAVCDVAQCHEVCRHWRATTTDCWQLHHLKSHRTLKPGHLATTLHGHTHHKNVILIDPFDRTSQLLQRC